MNRYTLTADGHRWWWGPALAGTAATAAVAAIVALPIGGQAMPAPTTRHEPSPAYVHTHADPASTPPTGGNCFIYRANWNLALDGPRPVCHWDAPGGEAVREHPGVLRIGLDSRP